MLSRIPQEKNLYSVQAFQGTFENVIYLCKNTHTYADASAVAF